jgi:preprotein translocase subunit SecD
MMNIKARKVVILLVVAAAVTSSCSFRVSRLFKTSGTEFTVRVETEKPNQDEITALAAKIIESKLDAIGIDGEASRVPETSDQIFVKLYGDQEDPERLKKFLFTTHKLEFRKAISPPNPAPLTTYASEAEARASIRPGQEVLPYADRDGETIRDKSPGRFIIVETDPIVTGEHIRNAEAIDRTGNDDDYVISFTLKKEGAEKFGEWTGRNIHNYLAVVLDGSVVSAAYIKSQIYDMGEITGQFTKESAEELAFSLSSGYLPARLTVLNERQFGN